ncbi:MAG: methyltransferase [Candidatus Hermodarchaeota archaeon]
MSKIASKSWEDASEEQEWRTKYLTQLGMLKLRQEFMDEQFSLLDFNSINHVLEIGCGLGNDAVLLIKHLKPGSTYLGVDIDSSLVEKANELFKKENVIHIARAETRDALSMPIIPNSTDLMLIHRVLEHLKDPLLVTKRVFELLKPGGQFLCIEPDWATISLNHPDVELNLRMLNVLATDVFNWGSAGTKLREWFVNSGFLINHIKTFSTPFLDFNFANFTFGLHRLEKFAVELGKISQEEATRWMRGLEETAKNDFFFGSLTMVILIGKKPLEK